jgi:hypothetical protein
MGSLFRAGSKAALLYPDKVGAGTLGICNLAGSADAGEPQTAKWRVEHAE